ncbi:putative P450 monooxygenase [Periconia macrospinosa]|uniref:Putative P450 monooxygenase n=1 Tax=Periconia macrospinosa TaxID=97972 RepID=A0A2V1DZE6_9PLEO|nr:putative P450 monooxygenase [Periconia macrospinosa]
MAGPTDLIGLAAVGLCVYLVGLGVYRLYFSPIAKFPGPKLAALTFWYEFYHDVVRGGQYVFKIDELHEQYGPIIRINPYELHVKDPDFYDVLYSGPGQRRDKWSWAVEMFGNSSSGFGTVSHDLHRLRRNALNPFFSKQAITRMEPLIRGFIEKLCARFEQCKGTSEPVTTLHVYAALTTDIITSYCFGTSYGCLEDPNWKWEWPQAMVESTRSCHLNKQFKWLFPAMQATPEWIVQRVNPPVMLLINFQKLFLTKQDLANQIKGIKSGGTSSKEEKQNIFRQLLDGDLPAEEKAIPRLVDEGQTMIAAGQETSSFFLQQASYFILANPDVHSKLKAELREAIPDSKSIPPLARLEELPYLHAVVQEVHRFSHGVVGRLERVSPDKIIQYKDWVIPPGTPVAMTSLLQHRDPSKFPNPMKFDPDRWLTQSESGRLEKYLVPFSKGTRQCMGINLATAEIYLTLATVFRRFDMELYQTSERDAEVTADFFIPHCHEDSKGVRVIFK